MTGIVPLNSAHPRNGIPQLIHRANVPGKLRRAEQSFEDLPSSLVCQHSKEQNNPDQPTQRKVSLKAKRGGNLEMGS